MNAEGFISPSEFCPTVEATGETLVFLVASESRSGMKHRVDLCAYDGWGACGCEEFSFRIAHVINAGIPPSKYEECKHIHIARRFFALWAEQAILRTKMDPKRQYNPEAPEC